jgi:hypothetical protein
MQEYKFNVTGPDALFIEPHQAHLSKKNGASMFRVPDAPE